MPSSPNPKPKLLFTGAGGAGTIEVLRSLIAKDRYDIVACDANAMSVGFTLVDKCYLLPFGAAPEFAPAFQAIFDREQPDFVIPLVDEEIAIVHDIVTRSGRDVKVLTPTPEFCRDALDKFRIFEHMRDAGLSHARTWLASNAGDAVYPAIVKPRVGRGSRGFALVDGLDDLRKYLAAANAPADRFMVQERLAGREFTTSVIVGLGGPLLGIVPKEALIKKGITQLGVTRRVPAIYCLCAEIQERLHADGPFNVQLMLGDDGIPRVFEINPRYSTTVALTVAAGIDEVDVVIQHALGKDIGKLKFKENLMMLRYLHQVFVDEASYRYVDVTTGKLP